MAAVDEIWDIGEDLNTIELYDDGVSTNEIVDNGNDFFAFDISVVNDYIGIEERTILTDGHDKLYNRTYAAHTRQNKQCSIDIINGATGAGRPSWINADYNGYVTHRENGNLTISATINEQTRSTTISLAGIPDPTYTFVSNVDRWVRKNAIEAIDTRVQAGGDINIYTTQDHTTPNYVRNPNCWAGDLDLTCISPWNSTGGANRAGALVSPRHILMAAHYPIGVGATIRFITMDNDVVTRTVNSRWLAPTGSGDLAVAMLDSDVPSSISYAKILPTNWNTYIMEDWREDGNYQDASDLIISDNFIPALGTDQEEKALCFDIDHFYNINGIIGFRVPTNLFRSNYYESWVGGDSGSPAFLIINDELVILCCAIGSTYGALYSNTIDYNMINYAMTTLGGGYQLTDVDLGAFNHT